MSRLIFEGDTVSRFGKSIPTPFIEKIKIYENDIVADIAIYLHITDDNVINQSIYEDLSNLELYAGFGIIYATPDKLQLGTVFELVTENIYNNEGQRFAKFVYSRSSLAKELPEYTILTAIRARRETYYSCFIAVGKDEDGADNDSLYSFEEQSEFDRAGIYSKYKNLSSPLVYEKVFTTSNRVGDQNGLATDPVVIYEDASGVPCESTPLESIQRNYYKTTENFRILLKDQIDGITSTFAETTNQQVQSFVDSISFVSETKSSDVDFIVELDKVRNSFPSRTSTSELGLLYGQLKSVLFAANDTLILGESLTKKLVPNTKLIDLRNLNLIQVEEWSRRDADSYTPRVDDTGDILYSNLLIERQQLETKKAVEGTVLNGGDVTTGTFVYDDSGNLLEPNYDVTSTFGYFFFDYEKALHKKSNISQIYEVQKLLNIFGNNSLDGYFFFDKTEMIRFAERDLIRKIISPYENNRPLTHLVLAAEDAGSRVVYKVVQQTELENEEIGTSTDIPYVIPRGFDTVTGLEGYRLMAFEFQDYEPHFQSLRGGGSYRFNVFVNDSTLRFYDFMVEIYQQSLADLKSYLEQAEDFCSYNNIDNRFNDFFAVAIKEQFVEDRNYPWNKAPKLFTIHADLINNQFNGNIELMSFYASNLSTTISPENGTLVALRNFVSQMEMFYNTYYGDEGVVTKIVSSRIDPDGNFATSLRDNTEFIATLGFDALPDVIDTTVDVKKPTPVRFNDGSRIFITENDSKYFIDSRAATLAMTFARGIDSYSEFVEFYNGVGWIGAINSIFPLNDKYGVPPGPEPPSYFSESENLSEEYGPLSDPGSQRTRIIANKRARKNAVYVIKFVNTLIRNLKNKSDTVAGYEQRKELIVNEIDNLVLFGGDFSNDKRAEFVLNNLGYFIDIGFVAIATEKNSLYNVRKWFANKTKNTRNAYSIDQL